MSKTSVLWSIWRINVQRAPKASSLAQMSEHFTATNELKSNVEIRRVLLATRQQPLTLRLTSVISYIQIASDSGLVLEFSYYYYLANSANLPEKLYVLLVLISFFFLFFFFNDCSETNYLRIHWTDFRNLFSK